MNIKSVKRMNDGNDIPVFGLGTYLMRQGRETRESVNTALEYGYRHIDTASIYGNETAVGRAVNESGIPREELFITTKVWNDDQGYDKTMKAFEESLKRLNLDYVDLYLIHWPLEDKRLDTWRALEQIHKDGLAKSIGVSNFMIDHLKELFKSSNIMPAVNQVEMSPYLNQKELIDFCRENDIVIEAYSPLVRGKKSKDERLLDISAKHNKTWAQILLRWGLQRDMVVLAKSSNEDRIKENADIFDFELSQEDMDQMDTWNEDYRVSWDPSKIA